MADQVSNIIVQKIVCNVTLCTFYGDVISVQGSFNTYVWQKNVLLIFFLLLDLPILLSTLQKNLELQILYL